MRAPVLSRWRTPTAYARNGNFKEPTRYQRGSCGRSSTRAVQCGQGAALQSECGPCDRGKRCARHEGCGGPYLLPEQPGETARDEQSDAARQIENTEGGTAEIRGRRGGDERRE